MTGNHLLLYRLAELMLEKEQHVLPVDDLFDDDQIGDFVKSIQIDSPYQQLLFEGVLTESVKEEQLYVSFTVEGYFHYVLGEVIYKASHDKEISFLSTLLKNNKLNGLSYGIEQSLMFCIDKHEFEVIRNLIQKADSFADVLINPLANAFLINSCDFIIGSVFPKLDDKSLLLLVPVINKFKENQKISIVSDLYKLIIQKIKPNNLFRAIFWVENLDTLKIDERKKYLRRIEKTNAERLEGTNSHKGDFYYALGNQFGFISEYQKAIVYFKKALGLKRTSEEEVEPILVDYYNSIGAALSYMGQYEKGISFYEDALKCSIELYGEIHPSSARSYNNLGTALYDMGKYDSAIKELENSLAIRMKLYGRYHPDTAKTYNSLGMVWKDKGDLKNAFLFHENAFQIRRKIYEENHTSVATSIGNLGTVRLAMSQFQEAIELFKKSLEIRLNNFGEKHNDVAVSYNNLAAAYSMSGMGLTSIEYFEKAADIWILMFSESHPHVASCFNNIGSIYSNEKNHEKALAYFERSLKIRIKVIGKKHPNTAITYENIGSTYFDLGQYEKAIAYFKKAVLIKNIINGDDNSQSGILYFNIGMSYMLAGEFMKAIGHFKRGMTSNPGSGGFPYKIAFCYESLHRHKSAFDYYLQAAELRKKQLGVNNESTLSAVGKCIEVNGLLKNRETLPGWINEIIENQTE